MSEAKYELAGQTIERETGWGVSESHIVTLHRIRALRDIPRHDVRAGDLGGYVQSEANLSHEGDAWIADRAWAYENAYVCDNALMCDDAEAREDAYVGGNASMLHTSVARGKSRIYEDATMLNSSQAHKNARLHGNACLSDHARIFDADVSGNIWMKDQAQAGDDAVLHGDWLFSGEDHIWGDQMRRAGSTRLVPLPSGAGQTDQQNSAACAKIVKTTGLPCVRPRGHGGKLCRSR